MKTTFKCVTSGLAAASIGAAMASAAFTMGGAGTDPLLRYGTEPQAPHRLGYVDSSHDEADTTNGQVDLPF
jgi:hypothetical protein